MPAFRLEKPCRAKDSQICALGSAACENNFTGFAAQDFGSPITSFIQNSTGLPANVMDAGRVAKELSQVWQHGFTHLSIQGSRGIVIEVNRGFHLLSCPSLT